MVLHLGQVWVALFKHTTDMICMIVIKFVCTLKFLSVVSLTSTELGLVLEMEIQVRCLVLV